MPINIQPKNFKPTKVPISKLRQIVPQNNENEDLTRNKLPLVNNNNSSDQNEKLKILSYPKPIVR